MTRADTMKDGRERLAEPLRAWVDKKGWRELRPIQREAIEAILVGDGAQDRDLVLSASTASGKTEAAFLPLLTRLVIRSEAPSPSFEILYLSPLKALINDMADRVREMAALVGRSAYRRHGDVRGKERSEMEARARGLLLTTPESLEAQFIRSRETLPFVFADLQAVVIDEIHAYFESPRGPLVSLLARLEAAIARHHGRASQVIPRIALSATLGGAGDGAEDDIRAFLRPEDPQRVKIVCPETVQNRIEVHLKAFTEATKGTAPPPAGTRRRHGTSKPIV